MEWLNGESGVWFSGFKLSADGSSMMAVIMLIDKGKPIYQTSLTYAAHETPTVEDIFSTINKLLQPYNLVAKDTTDGDRTQP